MGKKLFESIRARIRIPIHQQYYLDLFVLVVLALVTRYWHFGLKLGSVHIQQSRKLRQERVDQETAS
jgi:hypothetical protein